MRSFLLYSAARLALFLACWGVLWLVGAKGLLGAFLALLVSGLLSYVLLDRLRTRFSDALTTRFPGLRRGRATSDDVPDDVPDTADTADTETPEPSSR